MAYDLGCGEKFTQPLSKTKLPRISLGMLYVRPSVPMSPLDGLTRQDVSVPAAWVRI
jgi:hypothetical protein